MDESKILEELKKYIDLRYAVHKTQSQTEDATNAAYHRGAMKALQDVARNLQRVEENHE